VYGVLAERLVDEIPDGVAGKVVLDVGAGTGAASRAASARRARLVVGFDIAHGMLAHEAASRPPAVAGDALALPFRSGSFDAVVAAFSLNHVPEPERAIAEAARVLRAGGSLVASAYAADDDHPVKAVVDRACRERGWAPPAWYGELSERVTPLLATVDRADACVRRAGIDRASCERWTVEVPGLTPAALVEWRLGMAQIAPFVATLTDLDRDELVASAVAGLGEEPPPLVRAMIVIRAVAGR
jgi:SAM-dependent methyltransferase